MTSRVCAWTSLLAANALVACVAPDDPERGVTLGHASEAHHTDDSVHDDKACDTLDDQIARARAATDKYRDLDVALADGFAPSGGCVELPGVGAMGFHFVNGPRLMDPLVIEEPEALVYMADNGGMRLVAIEYLMPILVEGAPYAGCGVDDNSCPPENPPPAPVLFDGMPFDGPMAGHGPGMPWHFDQHVWLYEQNPAGLFATWNPALTCPVEPEPEPEPCP